MSTAWERWYRLLRVLTWEILARGIPLALAVAAVGTLAAWPWLMTIPHLCWAADVYRIPLWWPAVVLLAAAGSLVALAVFSTHGRMHAYAPVSSCIAAALICICIVRSLARYGSVLSLGWSALVIVVLVAATWFGTIAFYGANEGWRRPYGDQLNRDVAGGGTADKLGPVLAKLAGLTIPVARSSPTKLHMLWAEVVIASRKATGTVRRSPDTARTAAVGTALQEYARCAAAFLQYARAGSWQELALSRTGLRLALAGTWAELHTVAEWWRAGGGDPPLQGLATANGNGDGTINHTFAAFMQAARDCRRSGGDPAALHAVFSAADSLTKSSTDGNGTVPDAASVWVLLSPNLQVGLRLRVYQQLCSADSSGSRDLCGYRGRTTPLIACLIDCELADVHRVLAAQLRPADALVHTDVADAFRRRMEKDQEWQTLYSNGPSR